MNAEYEVKVEEGLISRLFRLLLGFRINDPVFSLCSKAVSFRRAAISLCRRNREKNAEARARPDPASIEKPFVLPGAVLRESDLHNHSPDRQPSIGQWREKENLLIGAVAFFVYCCGTKAAAY